MSELKPCPFCGQPPRNDNAHHSYPLAHCTNQDCVGSWSTVGAGGSEYHWNTRPLEAALQAQVDKLTALAKKMVAFGEIWEAEGTLSETEAELFDAAREALEGGE